MMGDGDEEEALVGRYEGTTQDGDTVERFTKLFTEVIWRSTNSLAVTSQGLSVAGEGLSRTGHLFLVGSTTGEFAGCLFARPTRTVR